jgi:hypothetical protein
MWCEVDMQFGASVGLVSNKAITAPGQLRHGVTLTKGGASIYALKSKSGVLLTSKSGVFLTPKGA